MPRPRRIHLEGALYYVTSRGEPGLPVFGDGRDVSFYLDLLSQYRAQFGFKLYAYALLADQVHLCLEPGSGATISQIMHDLHSRYTKYHGKRYDRPGHLFQGRYRATLVEKEGFLLPLTRFVHSLSQPMANSLSRYADSTISLVDAGEVLAFFPGENPVQAYGGYVKAASAVEMEQMRKALQKPILGSPDFATVRPEPFDYAQDRLVEGRTDVDEPELVPVPVRASTGSARTGARGKFLVALVAAGILSTGAGLVSLSGRTTAPNSGKVTIPILGKSEETPQKGLEAVPASVSQNGASPFLAQAPLGVTLNGTEWEIQMVPMYSKGTAPVQQDRLQFEQGKLTSKNLSAEGFSVSGVTLTEQPDGSILWETMQSHPGGATVFWRGEWQGGEMRGIFSRHPVQGAPEDFVFKGVNRSLDESSGKQKESTL